MELRHRRTCTTKSTRRSVIEWEDVELPEEDVVFVKGVANVIPADARQWLPDTNEQGVAKKIKSIPINKDWFKI